MSRTGERLRRIEGDKIIAELYRDGKSYDEIVKHLGDKGQGYSTNIRGVSVRVERLITTGVVKRQPKKAYVKRLARTSVSIVYKSKENIEYNDWSEHDFQGVAFVELKNNSCRFPFKNGSYCGKMTDKTYCDHHYSICYTGKGKRL